MNIKPTTDVLSPWIESYVPEKDFFFVPLNGMEKGMDFSDVLIMPIKEFYNHNTYCQISYLNSYEYWNIKNAHYVVIAESEWIEQLSEADRAFILNEQIQCERGLVLPASFIQDISQIPPNYVQNNQVVLQRSMWEKLSHFCKEQLLTSIVYEWWDKGDCEDIPPFLPVFLKPFANKFGTHQGANCLAAVLFAISEGKQQWFIHEWVHQHTFIEKLNYYRYEKVCTDNLREDDEIVWSDETNIIQHAAYYIGQNLFFFKRPNNF